MKTPKEILSDFKKLADKLNMGDVHIQVTCWDGSSESVTVTMYSKEKHIDNGQSKYSISACVPMEIYNVELITMKLEADLLEEKLKVG